MENLKENWEGQLQEKDNICFSMQENISYKKIECTDYSDDLEKWSN